MNMTISPHIKECIQLCWDCRTTCIKTLYHHCLHQGGKHAEAAHVRLMSDCIEICQTAADFMLRGSPLHLDQCRACAAVCSECAKSCAEFEEPEMQDCAELCRRCADSCSQMAKMKMVA